MRVPDRLYDFAETCGAQVANATVERVLRSLGVPQPAQSQDPRNEGRRIVRFESYADDQERIRLRLVFAD